MWLRRTAVGGTHTEVPDPEGRLERHVEGVSDGCIRDPSARGLPNPISKGGGDASGASVYRNCKEKRNK